MTKYKSFKENLKIEDIELSMSYGKKISKVSEVADILMYGWNVNRDFMEGIESDKVTRVKILEKLTKNMDDELLIKITEIIINRICKHEICNLPYKEKGAPYSWSDMGGDGELTKKDKEMGIEELDIYKSKNSNIAFTNVLYEISTILTNREINKKLENHDFSIIRRSNLISFFRKRVNFFIILLQSFGCSKEYIEEELIESFKKEKSNYYNNSDDVLLLSQSIIIMSEAFENIWNGIVKLNSESLISFLNQEMEDFENFIEKKEKEHIRFGNTRCIEIFKKMVLINKSELVDKVSFIKKIKDTKDFKMEKVDDVTVKIEMSEYSNYIKNRYHEKEGRILIIDKIKRKFKNIDNNICKSIKVDKQENYIIFKWEKSNDYKSNNLYSLYTSIVKKVLESGIVEKVNMQEIENIEEKARMIENIGDRELKKSKKIKF